MIARIATLRSSLLLLGCSVFVFTAMCVYPHVAFASDAPDVGRVLVAAGDTVAIRGTQTVSLKYGSSIQNGDTLRTGESSNLQVRFTDDSIVSMKESSELRIDNFKFTGKPDGSERANFTLLKGGLRTTTGAIGGKNNKNYKMVTSSATLGVRGTDYTITLCQADCNNHDGTPVKNGLYGRVLGISHGSNRIVVSTEMGSKEFGINENFFVADMQSPVQRLIAPAEIVPNRLEGRRQAAHQQASQESTKDTTSEDSNSNSDQAAKAGKEEVRKSGAASDSRVNAKPESVEMVEYVATQNLGIEGRSEVALPPRVVVYALDVGTTDTVIDGNAATISSDTQVTAISSTALAAPVSSDPLVTDVNSIDTTVTPVVVDTSTSLTSTLTAPVAPTVQTTRTVIDNGSYKLKDGSFIYWGRWSDTTVTTDASGTTTVTSPYVPFVMGDTATKIPTSGSFTYVFAGGPSVVDAAGNVGGALTKGELKVGFGATQSISVAKPLIFAINGETFSLSTACGGTCTYNGTTASMSMTLTGTCSGGVCGTSSAATSNATGTLVGVQATGLGVVGTVSSPAPTVTFAGAFKR
jgi:FecR protein